MPYRYSWNLMSLRFSNPVRLVFNLAHDSFYFSRRPRRAHLTSRGPDVGHRRLHRCVAKQCLNVPGIGAIFRENGRRRVPQAMESQTIADQIFTLEPTDQLRNALRKPFGVNGRPRELVTSTVLSHFGASSKISRSWRGATISTASPVLPCVNLVRVQS